MTYFEYAAFIAGKRALKLPAGNFGRKTGNDLWKKKEPDWRRQVKNVSICKVCGKTGTGSMATSNNEGIGARKARHISICTDSARYQVEPAGHNLFSLLNFLHNPLPELALKEIDTSVAFLGHKLKLPLFISCMTGGSEGGQAANRQLAEAAQLCGIPVGMGSIRILFSQPELFSHFHIKPLAVDVPVLANLGIAQLRELAHARIIEIVKRLEAQALVIHLNPGQEIFQPGGDTDFTGLQAALARFREAAPFPCIVKETGFGIPPHTLRYLLEIGIDYIDLAGSGGTNWAAVEACRLSGPDYHTAREFDAWGYPTPLLLELSAKNDRIIASGGLRTGSDLAKCLALGALLGGMALPLIRAVKDGGTGQVIQYIEQVHKSLRAVMLLTGSRDLSALRRQPLWREPGYTARLAALKAACLQAGDNAVT